MDQKDSGSGETGVQYSFVASGIIMGYMIEEQLLCKHNVQTSFPLPTGICTLHYRHPRRHRHVQTKTEHIFIQDRTYSFDLETGLENTHTHTHARTHARTEFNSVQDGIYALGKPTCAPPRLLEVSTTLPMKPFQYSSD